MGSQDVARAALAALPDDERLVLPALQAVQEAVGHVPPEAVALVAGGLNVSVADVHGVLTYYPDLRTEPPARVTVRVCAAEACTAVGGQQLAAQVRTLASEDVAATHVYCLGLCAVGPAVVVNARLVARATLETVQAAVARALAEEQG